MTPDALKLTTYFGERDRADGRLLADVLLDLYDRHELRASLLLRGVEGFGVKHRLQTDRLLSLSEDLPLVTVAIDLAERVEAILPAVREVCRHGLLTLERARFVDGRAGGAGEPTAKLTVWMGRRERLDGRPAHRVVVDALHARGVAGATVLLGVDGTAHGVRERARFFHRNATVPLVVVAVGDGERLAEAARALGERLPQPLMTLDRVDVCKRDGRPLGPPPALSGRDASGLGLWQKLEVYTSERARHDGRPLHAELIRRLRAAGADGATAVRGVWGYHGDHAPHGDRFWALERHVPIVTIVVDRPERVQRWYAIVDELTASTGLVTCETVPAVHAGAPGHATGGLVLAEPDAP